MRHLSEDQAAAALRRGRQIEQYLGSAALSDDRWGVRWLTISHYGNEYRVALHHVEDIGGPRFADLSELPPIDPHEHIGEGTEVASAADPADAIQAARSHGADNSRWVNQGVIGDEYLDDPVRRSNPA
ncbi:MAG: hypothetical protein GY701_23490 [Sulfitobacter sp.]|nr:hypothetical protein [Sulfitobacter sp.]